MDWETHRLESPTGASIAYRHLAAAPSARGILLISHGLAEHSRRYQAFARLMAGHGFHVYAWDHRGHGETTAPDAPIGRFSLREGARLVVEDLMAVRGLAASRHPDLPMVLFGHSMGGLITLNATVSHPDAFQAIAVWNSNFNPGAAGRAAQGILLAERALKGSDVPSGLLPKLTFGAWGRSIPGHRTAFDWLSHDPQVVDDYISDPLCGFDASVSLWLDVFELTFRAPTLIDRLPKELPINLVGGAEDPATDHGQAVIWLSERMRDTGLTQVAVKIWPEARHETLNDPSAAGAMDAFAIWAKQVTGEKQVQPAFPSSETRDGNLATGHAE